VLFIGVVTLLVLTVGSTSGSPLDRVVPEPVAMRIRMLTLREGMSLREAIRRLGLKDQDLDGGFVIGASGRESYRVGRTHLIVLQYSALTQELSSATLERDRHK
jgi:hypothetical protein